MRRLLLLAALLTPALSACTPSHCEVDGVKHRIGETYRCADGCNTCQCSPTGVSSTLMDCAEDTGGADDSGDTADSAE
ncbi:hypothetical protein L6R49_14435 [Myxococcota bacterium]|nr:hypothetical protein [Myxococcota bacterium]